MTASRELTHENILLIQKKIEETLALGEDVSELENELKKLSEQFSRELDESGKKVLKG
jgi:dephospho-CoA kinase